MEPIGLSRKTLTVLLNVVRSFFIRSMISRSKLYLDKFIYLLVVDDIALYGVNQEFRSTDGFLCLPVSALATDYYAVTFSPATLSTQIALVASNPSTTVQITLSKDPSVMVEFPVGTLKRAGESFSVTLDAFEAIQVWRSSY